MRINKLLALIIASLASLSIVSCGGTSSNPSGTGNDGQNEAINYSFAVENVSLILGESYKVVGKLNPTDFLYDVELEIIDGSSVAIQNNVIIGNKVGRTMLKATAKSIEGAYIEFSAETIFTVDVSAKVEELSNECELYALSVNGNDIPIIEEGTSLDYETYISLRDSKDDLSKIINAKISKYASITSATFQYNETLMKGSVDIVVTAEDGTSSKTHSVKVNKYYISHWTKVPLVNADFEAGYAPEGWDLENFSTTTPTSSASNIDLSPLKETSTRVISIYGNITDEMKEASLTQSVALPNAKVGNRVRVSCLVSTSYPTRIKSIKLVCGEQKIEQSEMASNWRAQIITQEFVLTEQDIQTGSLRIGMAFTCQDETSTSNGWMYIDDFASSILEEIYPEVVTNE